MRFLVIFTANGPLAVLTSHDSITDPGLLAKLKAKGVTKFVAYELPVDLARERYGTQFQVVLRDIKETDDLRVLDFNGDRIFRLFRFQELGPPTFYEGEETAAASQQGAA
jgi:hypothetical protein